ncbi:hypothetical protein FA95DRAFT_1602232 [Auriscalpium vulgare]|uniref:Uncharacterized protein n=1 Tax=Auriscalpium vulgare TaxID=40419 RepID=A0ACB8S876_9AGAM|nr:hypothetical protein FA95DRAFT_1602232 [Auriscalpium vulgare]
MRCRFQVVRPKNTSLALHPALHPPPSQISSGTVVIATGEKRGHWDGDSEGVMRVRRVRMDKLTHAAQSECVYGEETGKEAIFLKLNLADLTQVRMAAEDFLSEEKELRILLLNAWGPTLNLVKMKPLADMLLSPAARRQYRFVNLGAQSSSQHPLPRQPMTRKLNSPGTSGSSGLVRTPP